jgi:hypothetical protein
VQDRDPSDRDPETTRDTRSVQDRDPSDRDPETTRGSPTKDTQPSDRRGETAPDASTEDRDPSDRDPGTSGHPFCDSRPRAIEVGTTRSSPVQPAGGERSSLAGRAGPGPK